MKLIDEYLNDLYKNNMSKENLDLKEEMRQHLIESTNELKLEGFDDKEACKKAIERFDGGSEMQQELHTIIKDLPASLNIHKSTLKSTKKIIGIVAIISFLISGTMWHYHKDSRKNLEKDRYNLTQDFNDELKKLAKKYDMIDIDKYKVELEKLLNEEKFDKVKLLEIVVADMEEGNTSLDSSNIRAKSVYNNSNRDIDMYEDKELYGYNTTDFLDSHGNIVNPQIFTDHSSYNKLDVLVPLAFSIGLGSLLGYIALTAKKYIV